jgi:hypothetical protein
MPARYSATAAATPPIPPPMMPILQPFTVFMRRLQLTFVHDDLFISVIARHQLLYRQEMTPEQPGNDEMFIDMD